MDQTSNGKSLPQHLERYQGFMKKRVIGISLFIMSLYFQVAAGNVSSNKNYSIFQDLYNLRSQISYKDVFKGSPHYKDSTVLGTMMTSDSFYDLGNLVSHKDITFVPRYCSAKYDRTYGAGISLCEDNRSKSLHILMQYIESIIYKISKTNKGKEILLKLVNNNPRRFVETLGFSPENSNYLYLTARELNLDTLLNKSEEYSKHQANDYIRGFRSYSFILKSDHQYSFDSWTDNKESTYFMITPDFFEKKNKNYDELLVRMIIHELSISADGKSEISFNDFKKISNGMNNMCHAYSITLNPYISMASAQLRAFYDEEQVLFEMGFLKKYKIPAKNSSTCIENLHFSQTLFNNQWKWIKINLNDRLNIYEAAQCGRNDNLNIADANMANKTIKDIKGLCQYLTNNNYYSVPSKRNNNWSKGPRPRIGDGGGVKIDTEEKP